MFKENLKKIFSIFENANTLEEKYLAIIELGKKSKKLPIEYKKDENIVDGCQSTTYVYSNYENGVMHFEAESDALISSGLAAILIIAYDNLPPETILQNPPDFLTELDIHASLSPNRANGLYQMYNRIQNEAKNALK